MSTRQARRERREAERKAKKAELKRLKTQALETEPDASAPPPVRAEINRANAQFSTGPRTVEGKLASSRNSLKHGLASGDLLILGEDPAEFELLLEDLVAQHQPANPTEELLIQEMAQSWWLTQRAIRLQNECFAEFVLDEKRLALFLRYQTTHERAFHKALNTLLRLQKERGASEIGFVPQNAASAPLANELGSQNAPPLRFETGFVSQSVEKTADSGEQNLKRIAATSQLEAA